MVQLVKMSQPTSKPKPEKKATSTWYQLLRPPTQSTSTFGFNEAHYHPLKFADPSFEMNWVGNFIKTGEKMRVKGWKSYHPGNFIVILRRNWNSLEKRQTQLNSFYNGKLYPLDNAVAVKKDPRFFLDPNSNNLNLYVAVYDDEWYRGLILECNVEENKSHYKVMMIDYGLHKNFPLKSLRRIPVRYLDFPAQAITCSLQFSGKANQLNQKDYEWTSREADIFQEIMADCNYFVEFASIEIRENIPKYPLVWKCRVQLLDNSVNAVRGNLIPVQVADLLLEKLQEKFEKQQKKTKINVENYEKNGLLLQSDNTDRDNDPLNGLEECAISPLKFTKAENSPLE